MGEYEHSLDAKGRLIMPAKLREDMGEKFIITKGLDGCLFGFSQNEWENFETKLKTLPLTNKNARDFVRFFLSGAMECEIDKQGRFLISSNLRNVATLEKEVVIIGVAMITTNAFVLVSMPKIAAPFAPYNVSMLSGRR